MEDWVRSRDRNEAVRDLGLRLVHHRDDDALPARRGRDPRRHDGVGRWRPPRAEHAGGCVAGTGHGDVADDHRGQLARREALSVEG